MRKKIFLIFLCLFVAANSSIFEDKDGQEYVRYEDLPKKAKDFISEYFKDYEVVKATRTGFYNVVFKGGSSINFNIKGEWTSVIGNSHAIPVSFIDEKILKAITSKYGGVKIMSISKKSKGYRVKLDNKTEFDIDFNANITKTRNYK